MLGGEINVPTLEGSVRMQIKAGTQPDSKLRLRGKGVPRYRQENERGDLIVSVKAHIPPLNGQQKELLEKCRKEVQQRYAQSFRVYKYSHACRFCESSSCAYRSQCEDWVNRLDMNLYWSLLTANNQKLTFTSMLRMCRRAENDMGQKLGMDKELCFMGLAMEKFPMKDLQRALIMTQYYVKRGKWIAEQAQKTEKKEE
jgi:hypothetical protein